MSGSSWGLLGLFTMFHADISEQTFVLVTLIGVTLAAFASMQSSPLAYAALILLELAVAEVIFTKTVLIVLGLLIVLSMVLDYVLPLLGAKLYGATKYGLWGSLIGMLAGMILFPPFGLILGILIGAIVGEIIAGKKYGAAFQAGFASVVASMLTFVFKISLAGIIAFYYIQKIVQLF